MENRVPGPGGRTSLRGRARECAALDGLLGDIRRGDSRSLVLRGEAGIGKTALLECVIELASDLTVVRAVGVESEMELAYASLHQLCAPMLDRLEALPAPQRDALEIVFGLSCGLAPDRFLVGLGVLSLFSEVGEERPLLCVVDDAQWLDQASALILAFVARRLLAEPVGILFAAREPGEELQHLPQLEVRGLRNDDARALLGSSVRFKLDARVRERIVAEMRGNPLALLELPRGLTPTQLAGGFGLLEAQALSGRIEESFWRRLEALPEQARLLSLVAAAEPVGDPVLVWSAAERLGIELSAAPAAETEGLLLIGERVVFRHPLVRSAVYRAASSQERRAVHLALAEVTDQKLDPDRRAWHLAAAAPGPDEEVACELERSAGRAQARGGLAAAAAFLERSVALTQDPTRRAERALAAAQADLQAGALDAAVRLVETTEDAALDELQRARLERLRAQLAYASRHGSDATPLLLAAARRLERIDPGLARETYLDAFFAALTTGRLSARDAVLDVAEATRTAPRGSGPARSPCPADLLLDGLAALITDGYAAGAPILKQALSEFCDRELATEQGIRWLPLACKVAHDLWDDESWDVLSGRLIDLARDVGALTILPIGLSLRFATELFAGAFTTADALREETEAVSEATRSDLAPYGSLLLAAWRGREQETVRLIGSATPEIVARGEGQWLTASNWATAVLYNGRARFEEARVAAEQAREYPHELGLSNWALTELVEAAARSGKPERAVESIHCLSEMASATGSDWALGNVALARAVVGGGEGAESSYREAIERLGRTRIRVQLARARLLYGEWLRRESRRIDARAELRAAHDQFTAIGMDAFADRARQELLATGEKVRKRTVETRDELTGQERQIAQLARDGLSNPEIGARLFLSPRTVEWHLRKVFAKLGIRSRRELASALAVPDSEPVPA
jgi:DNA-binding CsgD family transcriptional regulator